MEQFAGKFVIFVESGAMIVSQSLDGRYQRDDLIALEAVGAERQHNIVQLPGGEYRVGTLYLCQGCSLRRVASGSSLRFVSSEDMELVNEAVFLERRATLHNSELNSVPTSVWVNINPEIVYHKPMSVGDYACGRRALKPRYD